MRDVASKGFCLVVSCVFSYELVLPRGLRKNLILNWNFYEFFKYFETFMLT